MDIFLKSLGSTIYSVLRIAVDSKIALVTKSHTAIEGECTILGNGPSLTKDMVNLKYTSGSYNYWCVNAFASSNLYQTYKPKYYVLADPGWWINNGPKESTDIRNNVLSQIGQNTEWNMVLFLPAEAKYSDSMEMVIHNKFIKLRFFNRTPVTGFRWFRHFCYRHSIGMPPVYNVLIAACTLAINEGYKNVAILGADHSFHKLISVGTDNLVRIKEDHFYGKSKSSIMFKRGVRTETRPFKIHEIFYDWGATFLSHNLVSEYADHMGVQIVNFTERSFIDAYRKTTP